MSFDKFTIEIKKKLTEALDIPVELIEREHEKDKKEKDSDVHDRVRKKA